MLKHLILFTLLSAALSARAEAPAAYQTCVACHGAAGEGNVELESPALAGQDAAYLERQLRNFRAGIRGADPKDTLGAQMAAMAATLPETEIPAVVEYLAGLAPVPVEPEESADLRNGNNLYGGNCGACHGAQAEGNAGLNSPALAWLDADYLRRQIAAYQEGLRGSDPEDKYGRQMQLMSKTIAVGKDLDDVIAYMHAQGAAGQ